MIGRTHGIHAEPYHIWLEARDLARGRRAEISSDSTCGRRYSHGQDFRRGRYLWTHRPEGRRNGSARADLAARRDRLPGDSRDLHAAFSPCARLWPPPSARRIALEVRHLQRTEVREAEEPFGQGQKGVAMPHKRNPVTCEQICGLARVVAVNVQAATRTSRFGMSATSRTPPSSV